MTRYAQDTKTGIVTICNIMLELLMFVSVWGFDESQHSYDLTNIKMFMEINHFPRPSQNHSTWVNRVQPSLQFS